MSAEHPPGFVEAQQFALPVVPSLDDPAALRAVLARLPLPRAEALRDQLEAELSRAHSVMKRDFEYVAKAGPGALARFHLLLSPPMPGEARRTLLGRDRTKLRLLFSLARLCAALEQRAPGGGRRR